MGRFCRDACRVAYWKRWRQEAKARERADAVPLAGFRLTLASMPGQVSPEIRLRQALKVLRRRFGLRCESVEEIPG